MSGIDHSQPNHRFTARGNGYEEHDHRDAKIERLRQRVRELETNSFDRYDERVYNIATNLIVDEHEDTNDGYDNLFAHRHYRQHQPPHRQHKPHPRQPQQPVDPLCSLAKFLPVTYKQDAYLDYQNLKHGSLSVEELISEFRRMWMRCCTEEDEEQIIARFLGILRPKIADIVSLQQYYSFSDVCQLALRVECQLAQKSKTFSKFSAYLRTPTACLTNTRFDLIKADPPVIPTTQTDDTEPKYDTEEEEAPEVLYPDRGEVLFSRRLLSTILVDPEDDTKWFRNNIFHTECTKKGKVCMVIIDGESCENMVATTMVEKPGLPIQDHPEPYQLTWLKKDGLYITLAPLHPRDETQHIAPLTKGDFVGLAKHQSSTPVFGLSVVEENPTPGALPAKVIPLVDEFFDIFPDDIPTGLPFMREIQYCIDFFLGVSIPNKPAYRMNPKEFTELHRQVTELLEKGLLGIIFELIRQNKNETKGLKSLFKNSTSWWRIIEDLVKDIKRSPYEERR
ncbi:hypothetical protein Tco_1525156 [Tanacetum coccineum]